MIKNKIIILSLLVILNFLPQASFANPQDCNNARFNKAIREYKKQADSGSLEGYLNLAVLFKDLGYYNQSIKVLKIAVSRFPDETRLKSLLARLYYLNDNMGQAIKILEQLNKNDPEDLDTLINLGLCFVENGNDAVAQDYFKKVIAINKNNVLAHLSLADLYYRQDKFLESIGEYKSVNILDASINRIYKYWAEVLYRMRDYKDAYRLYQKVIAIEPNNKFVRKRIEDISEKLGRDFFVKQKAEREKEKKKKILVWVKPVPVVRDMVFLRIGLIQAEGPIEFKSSGQVLICSKSGKVINFSKNNGDSLYIISRNPDNKINLTNNKGENIVVNEPIVIKPLTPQGTIKIFNIKSGMNNYWANEQDRSYRGEMEVKLTPSGLSVVNVITLEEYLYSVVPSEMPSGWPKEALKTQAVAARSEAMAKRGRHKEQGFDFCAEVHCQVYSGVDVETETTTQAVDETRGQILIYKSQPIDAVYSSNCGGHTQNNVFGEKKQVPYLEGRIDSLEDMGLSFPLAPWDFEEWLKNPPSGILCDISEYNKSSNFRWVRVYSASEMEEMVGAVADLHNIKKIVVLKRNKSGHIDALKVVGSSSSCTIDKELNIRKIFGNLRSSMFKVEMKYDASGKPAQFIFYGGGWGHGVGMCQAGANGMAKLGKNYRDILKHYFKGVEFKKLY